MTRVLAGDFGGTRARLALVAAAAGQPAVLERQQVYSARDFADAEAVVVRFLADHGSPAVAVACFCVAGPVSRNHAWLTNLGWTVDGARLADRLRLERLELVNDLVATALGMPALGPDDILDLNPMAAPAEGTAALIGVGTGLGMALLVRSGGRVVVAPSEAGHVELAARDEDEWALRRFLEERLGGRVSVERVASGSGLRGVYEFLLAQGHLRPAPGIPERVASEDAGRVIGEAALAGSCPVAVETVRLFAAVLGSFAGDMALAAMARGGVYLGGGVPPRVAPLLADGTFLRAFTDKGRLSAFVEPLPVRVILRQDTALLGAGRRAAELAGLAS
jgi:glucokinase